MQQATDAAVLVVGSGLMGLGIAHAFAAARFPVCIYSRGEHGRQRWLEYLSRERARGRLLDSDAQQLSEHVGHLSGTYEGIEWADLIVESIVEDEQTKLSLLRCLSAKQKSDAVIATNTSSISVTRLSESTRYPEKFIGMHFVSPVPAIGFVELVRGRSTADATVSFAESVIEAIGKAPLVVKDTPGFLINRLIVLFFNEAVKLLEEGVAPDAASLDKAMQLSMNLRVGPLRLGDLAGLDVMEAVLSQIHKDLRAERYEPARLLRSMVAQGLLGKKSGRGFYEYACDDQ